MMNNKKLVELIQTGFNQFPLVPDISVYLARYNGEYHACAMGAALVASVGDVEQALELNSTGHIYQVISKQLGIAPSFIKEISMAYSVMPLAELLTRLENSPDGTLDIT